MPRSFILIWTCTWYFVTSFLPLSMSRASLEGQPLPVFLCFDSIGSLMHQLVPRTPAWPISGNSQYITKCFLLILSRSFLHEFLLKGNSDCDTLHQALSLYIVGSCKRTGKSERERVLKPHSEEDNNELLIPYVKVIHCRAMAFCVSCWFSFFYLKTLNWSINHSIRLPSTLDT